MFVAIGLAVLVLIGVPLYSLFAAASVVLFLGMPEGGWAAVGVDVFGTKFADNPSLVTLLLFSFAGYLLSEAGTPQRLVRLAKAWLLGAEYRNRAG